MTKTPTKKIENGPLPRRNSTLKCKDLIKGVIDQRVTLVMGGGTDSLLTTHREYLMLSKQDADEIQHKTEEIVDSYSYINQHPVRWTTGVEQWRLTLSIGGKWDRTVDFDCSNQKDMYEVYEKIYSLLKEVNARN